MVTRFVFCKTKSILNHLPTIPSELSLPLAQLFNVQFWNFAFRYQATTLILCSICYQTTTLILCSICYQATTLILCSICYQATLLFYVRSVSWLWTYFQSHNAIFFAHYFNNKQCLCHMPRNKYTVERSLTKYSLLELIPRPCLWLHWL